MKVVNDLNFPSAKGIYRGVIAAAAVNNYNRQHTYVNHILIR